MERASREIPGSLLAIVPREIAKRKGWRVGDRMSFEETKGGVMLDRTRDSRKVVYTLGYEGRSLEGFLALLKERKVRRVIDVRELPLSRKKGFSRRQLQSALAQTGVGYVPIRALGSPRAIRREYRAGGSFEAFSRKYDSHLEANQPSLVTLRTLSAEMPSAILCFERDWRACHRSMLASFLLREGFRLEHL